MHKLYRLKHIICLNATNARKTLFSSFFSFSSLCPTLSPTLSLSLVLNRFQFKILSRKNYGTQFSSSLGACLFMVATHKLYGIYSVISKH